MKIQAVIQQTGKTATGIEVPPEVVENLGAGKRPKVRVTINGYTYRSSIASMNGVFMVGVSAEARQAAGVAGGDKVAVELELDTEPRLVTLPPDFQAALDRDLDAREFFEGLSYSKKQRFVLSVEGAKTAGTRQRRIEKAVSALHDHQA